MKAPLKISLGALALSVLALAATLVNSATPRMAGEAPLQATPSAGQAELLARLEALDERQRELRDRLALLENRPVPLARTPIADDLVSRAELEALQEQVRIALAGRDGLAEPLEGSAAGEFTERVSEAMSEIRVREATEQARRRVESRSERLRERMPWAAEQLGLSWQQQTAMESALTDMYERQESYGVMWETGEVGAKEDFGPIAERDMETFYSQLGGFLSTGQVQSYMSLGGGGLFPGSGGGGK